MYRLHRYSEQGVLFGVCVGLGKFLHIDPTLVRIAYVLSLMFSGHFFICIGVYVMLTLLMPNKE